MTLPFNLGRVTSLVRVNWLELLHNEHQDVLSDDI
jgi:hypothetical protein